MDQIEVVVGRIGRPHGIRGELRIDVRTDEPERRYVAGAVLRAVPPRGVAGPTSLRVAASRWHSGTLLVRFAEITDRTAAEAARGTLLHASLPADATPDDPDEFYDHQLIGLRAYDLDGTELGTLAAVNHGAQDLLVIRTEDGRDALVPFVAALVPEVDIAGGRIVVADRPGLVTPLPD